jgi:uncharacterized protein (DUF305 family)
MKRTLASLAAAALLVAGLTGCGDSSTDTDTDTGSSSGESAASSHNDADLTFVQGMIPHHEQAVHMADMADDAASSAEVRDLAERIEAAQEPEIETMQGWLEDWGVEEDSHGSMEGMGHGSGMPGMMSDSDLRDLDRAGGRAFDRMFLTMMIAHHEGAIEMSETELADGQDPDVKALAKDIAAAQTKEIAEMKRLLRR